MGELAALRRALADKKRLASAKRQRMRLHWHEYCCAACSEAGCSGGCREEDREAAV